MDEIKVLIIDDSELVRNVLTNLLNSDPQLTVVGTAEDPYQARELIKQLNPDVLTLDVEMPRMNGITFLRNLMRLRPMPVVMISTLTEQGTNITLEALEIGAVDYIAKPQFNQSTNLSVITREICAKVRQAAGANISAYDSSVAPQISRPDLPKQTSNYNLIAIGASTGGTEAIRQVIHQLPMGMPPIVVVQHMPPGFTASYANRLDRNSNLTVLEVNDNRIQLKESHVYVAHGATHLKVERRSCHFYGVQYEGDPVNRHKPSVDVLFDSVAQNLGSSAIGILLTGMGNDGAQGLLNMRHHGALTIAQDEKSSVVWGMPRAAVEKHAATYVMDLYEVAAFLVECCFSEHSTLRINQP